MSLQHFRRIKGSSARRAVVRDLQDTVDRTTMARTAGMAITRGIRGTHVRSIAVEDEDVATTTVQQEARWA